MSEVFIIQGRKPASGGGGWTDDGTVVRLDTSTDNVSIGTATAGGKLFIDGDTDEIQLQIQANATQTSDVLVIENSSGTDMMTVAGDGGVLIQPPSNITDSLVVNRANGDALLTADTTNNRIGFGPVASLDAPFHFQGSNGELRIQSTGADTTNKNGRMSITHYDLTEEPFVIFLASANNGANTINYGGGSASYNSATQLNFYAAADSTTTSGSRVIRMTSDGVSIRVGGNATAPTSPLDVFQDDASGAVPVISLEQDDISEPFIAFAGNAASATLTQSFVAEADVTTATRQGFFKIDVDDQGNQITDGVYFVPFYSLS